MGSYAVLAGIADRIHGHERDLSSVSSDGRWKVEMQASDDLVYSSVDGGAWTPIIGPLGILVTLDQAYDYTGAGAGRTITADAGAVVINNAAANNNNILELNKSPAGAQSGNALNVVMGANATGSAAQFDWRATAGGSAVKITNASLAGDLTGSLIGLEIDLSDANHGNQLVEGLRITGPATGVAAATKQGLLNMLSRGSAYRSFALSVRNKSAGTDGLMYVDWDTTNFEGAVADSILTDETNMLVLDGQANVDAATNNVLFRNLWIKTPATTSATAAGIRIEYLHTGSDALVLVPGSQATNSAFGVSFSRAITPTGGTTFTGGGLEIVNTPGDVASTENGVLVSISHSSGVLATDTTTGLSITMTPGASSAVEGVNVVMAANTSAAGYAATFDWRGSAGTAAGNGIVNIEVGAATTLNAGGVEPLTGLEIDLQTNITANDNAVYGTRILTPATTRASTDGEGALTIMSQATAAKVLNLAVRNTRDKIAHIYYDTATTLTTTLTGLHIDLDTSVNASDNAVVVNTVALSTPATTFQVVSDATRAGSLVITSGATTQRIFDVVMANTRDKIALFRYTASTNLAAALTGIDLNLATNVVPSTFDVTGMTVTIPSNGGANASAGYVITRSGAATATGAYTGSLVNVQNTPTGGGAGVTLTENGVLVNINHAPIAGATAITDTTTAFRVTLSPSTADSTGLQAIDVNFGANVTGGVLNSISWTGAATLSAATTGLLIDMTSSVTPGNNAVVGLAIDIGASNSASAAGIDIDSSQLQGSGLDIAMAPGIAATVVGLKINMGANSAGQGLLVTHGGTTAGVSSVALRLAGADESVALEMTDGDTVGVSAASEGRLVYDATLQAFRVSMNTGAYVYLVTSASGAALSLQNAYGGGASITATATNPVVIQNAAGVSSNLLALTEANTATNAHLGLVYTRNTVPALDAAFTGSAISIGNTPTGTNNCTEGGSLISISHAPVGGAGTITDTTVGLSIAMTPVAASAVTGASITMSADATGRGLLITHNRATAAAGTIALRLAGADESVGIELTDGDTVGVSAASEGRLVYDATLQAFRVSANTGAYAYLVTSTSGAALTLQNAYGGGATITATAANPVTIQNAADVSSNLLALTEVNTATNAHLGLVYTRNTVPTAEAIYTGGAISISNTPTGTNNCAEGGSLISISHAPVAGAGTITDTTTGLALTMTPASSGAVKGVNVVVGANTSTAGYAATFDWRGTAGAAAGNGAVNVTVGSATVFTGQMQMLVVDFNAATTTGGATTLLHLNGNSNLTAGANALVGIDLDLVGSTSVSSYAIDIDSAQKGGAAIDINLTAGDPGAGVVGINMTCGANVTGNAITIVHSGTGMGFSLSTALTTGTLNQISTPVLTATGAVSALAIDLTNFTGGLDQRFQGLLIYTPQSTADFNATSTQGALAISSLAERLPSINVLMKNKRDSAFIMGFAADPTRTAALVGLDIDLQTNGGTADFAVTGLRIRTPNGMATAGNQIALDIDGQIKWATGGDGAPHLVGPTDTQFQIHAGTPSGTAAGREVQIAGSAASTTGDGGHVYLAGGAAASAAGAQAGGTIELAPGAGAGGGARGAVKIGMNSADLLGFFGTAPAGRPAAYTPTNVSTDRSYDANATSIDEIADVLGTVIADLQTYGLLQ